MTDYQIIGIILLVLSTGIFIFAIIDYKKSTPVTETHKNNDKEFFDKVTRWHFDI